MPEMIAMLNGLPRPASQMLPPGVNPNFDMYRYRLNGLGALAPAAGLNEADLRGMIAEATEADVTAVEESIKAGAVDEATKAKLLADLKKKFRKFYQNPWYWAGIAVVAWVGYRYYTGKPVIPSFAGLGGDGGGSIMLDRPEQIRHFRNLTLLRALESEVKYGMQMTRGPSAYARIKREFGLKGSKAKVLAQFRMMVKGA